MHAYFGEEREQTKYQLFAALLKVSTSVTDVQSIGGTLHGDSMNLKNK